MTKGGGWTARERGELDPFRHPGLHGLQRPGQLAGVAAAGHRQVRLAAALAAHLLGDDLAADGSYGVVADGQYVEIPPGETAELKVILEWHVPPDLKPTIAVVRGTFSVLDETGDTLAQCEPMTFVAQSRVGALA